MGKGIIKGIYLKYHGEHKPVKTNVYPVPNLKNPFLGVHFTITVDGTVKIGPTSVPALWRENYSGLDNFNVVQGDQNTVHVLNAVSPAFICSFPFAKYVVENYILN